MKILKYILIILGGLLGIYILLCLAGPKDLNVTETTNIEAPPVFIYNLVNNLENGEMWNDWSLRDTTMQTTYNGVEEGIGAKSTWTSKNQGSGTQEIIESTRPNLVKSQLSFEGWEGVNHSTFRIQPINNGSSVTWDFESGSPFPFVSRGVYLLIGMKKHMKKAYAAGLTNLKRIAEARSKSGTYFGYDIQEKMVEERHFIMHRDKVRFENMQQYYATHLGTLFSLVQRAKVEMDGMPCGLYFAMNEKNQTADMAAAIPVATPLSVKNATSFQISGQRALVTDHYGPYSGLGLVHEAMEAYMKDRNYLFDPPSIEEYVSDPGVEKDPNKIQTTVTYYFTD